MKMERTCKKCRETKPLNEFAKSNECNGGYRYTCKVCLNKSRLRPISQKLIDRIDLFRRGLKICCVCKEIKPLYDFYPRSKTADGLETNCKSCSNKISNTYKKNNREKIKIKTKEWELKNLYKRIGYRKREYFKNFEKYQSYGRKYRTEHVVERRDYGRNYAQNKRKINDRNYIDKHIANNKKCRDNCCDSYVLQFFTNMGFPKELIINNPVLFEAKREQLKLIHLLKTQNENS